MKEPAPVTPSKNEDDAQNVVPLRQRQKLARQDQIIEAARSLFVTIGYDKTTMEAVAEAALVGVATVYTYFENKEGVAAAIIRKDNTKMFEEAEALLERLPEDPAGAVSSLTAVFEDFNRFITAELLRDFIIHAKGSGRISETLAWCHRCQIDLIDRVLVSRQQTGLVSRDLDTLMAAKLIADLLDRHVSRLTKSPDPGALKDQLTEFVRLLFKNWSSSKTVT